MDNGALQGGAPQGAPRMCDCVYYDVFSKFFSNIFFVVANPVALVVFHVIIIFVEEDKDKIRSEDERTAAFLCEVANSIYPSITVKSNYPSKNTDQKMPLLDLKLWVEDNS